MRATANANGLGLKAYAGVTGVLLAFNLESDDDRKGLLGFAIERRKGSEDHFKWLCGMLDFPGRKHADGELIPTNQAPIQKFRWSDYTVRPGAAYTYRVHAVYGDPNGGTGLDIREGVEVMVQTEAWSVAEMLKVPNQHHMLFNRAAGASQAFSRDFSSDAAGIDAVLHKEKNKKPGQKRLPLPSSDALAWLSRGVKEGIVEFIQQARDGSFALDVAIYQYELDEIVKAVNDADGRGVKVRLIYHAKPGDKQTQKNEASAKALPAERKVGRKTSAIFHHKFIVLSQWDGKQRTPIAVLAGSTNFTFNGVYCQANDIHVSTDSAVAQKYLEQFECIFDGEAVPDTRNRDTAQNVLDPSAVLQVGFSPRSGKTDLACFVSLINSARQDMLFSTAFNMDSTIYEALAGHPHDSILRFGIQDKKSKITGLHADRTADFEATALLPKGLEGWLREQKVKGQTGNILIHTKVILVDFTSDEPVIISGSHNFSSNASQANDENYMICRGNRDLADAFGCEILRLYDHYRYRYVTSQAAARKNARPPHLTPDDSWTNDYYDPEKLKYADRLVFSGAVQNRDVSAAVQKQAVAPSVQRLMATKARGGRN